MSTKLKVGAAVVVLLGLAVVFMLQQRKITRLMTENADLRSQLGRLASLSAANESLARQLEATRAARTNQDELLRLRAQGARLRQLEQENVQLKSERQQLATQLRQSQATVVSAGTEPATAVAEKARTSDVNPDPSTADLGALELQGGVTVHFDLGGGTNCSVTPTVLADGNNLMEIKLGVTSADGTFSELGTTRLTALPGQQCAISVGPRTITLAVTVKP